MPELPEVEVVRRGLVPHVTNTVIHLVEVRHPRSIRRNIGSFEERLQGTAIHHISRRGKFMWFVLNGPDALVVHLGMSGQFRIYPMSTESSTESERDHPHLRLRFELDRNSGGLVDLHFLDQRTFGGMHLSPMTETDRGEQIPESVTHIARDPLDPHFSLKEFTSRLAGKTSEIKRVLLDQTVISGVGNIYADEALFRSGLHGSIIAGSLPERSVEELVTHVKDVMNEALVQGGTSFDALYVHVNGDSGYFSRSLSVYGREGEPCERCGSLISRVKFMNRSSFFCAQCQPRTPVVARK